ncbi:MAG TPA: response regulator [Kofleriaceae bacterium]
MTVLVVDDNAENRALAQATLEDEDIAVELVTSGVDAIDAFARAQHDCILMDIRMPGLDGIATCERIRALPGGDRVAILFVTAQRDVETFDRALRAGGDDFITKPFRPGELVVRIQTATRLRRLAAAHDALAVELKRQRDELQRLQLEKEQLSAFLVHDLKNPVHAIELNTQRILRSPTADGRARDAAQKIQQESRGLLRLITNLLDIGRADAGQLAPVRAAVDIDAVVATAADELRLRAADATVELAVRVQPRALRVDRDLVHRVLVNLVENAIRHAPEASVVRVDGHDVAGGYELRVADAGAGVPPERREAVFERFVTDGGATNRGLGLAFAKIAVEAHGGRIWIEDAAPGAVFCIYVPD